MKKIKSLLVVLCAFFMFLTACGKNDAESQTVRVGSLKGPTSIGLVNLMEDSKNGNSEGKYEFTMETGADTLLGLMTSGQLDIALVPANVASVLYNKTEGNVLVIDINTLGVLYMVSADDGINSVNDLKGKKIYLTGKGTTPDIVLQYLLDSYGLSDTDVTIEYMSEATEALNAIMEDNTAVALLPQPFATAALIKDESLKTVIDTTEAWNAINKDCQVVTGVTIVRKEFLENNKEAVNLFMKEHKLSAEKANSDVETSSTLCETYGIIEKAPIAKKAIPMCNITYIDGNGMMDSLSKYYDVLSEYNIQFLGGSVPSEDFYYIEK